MGSTVSVSVDVASRFSSAFTTTEASGRCVSWRARMVSRADCALSNSCAAFSAFDVLTELSLAASPAACRIVPSAEATVTLATVRPSTAPATRFVMVSVSSATSGRFRPSRTEAVGFVMSVVDPA